MIPDQHPFVRRLTSANARFHHGVRLQTRIHVHFHVRGHRAREPVLDRQRALPISRRLRAVHLFEQWFRVAPRKRKRRDFRQRPRFFRLDVPCARNRSPAWRCRVAWHDIVVSNRAALNVAFWPPRSVGKNFSPRVAILRRIGINQQRRCAFAFRRQRFEPTIAVRIRIAHQDDFPFDADAVFAQQIIVFRIPAVRVDHFRRDVARSRISKVCTGNRGILRVWIRVNRIFAQRRRVMRRRGHFQRNAARARMQNFVASQRHIFPALLSPLIRDVIRELVVALGCRGMRLCRERPVPLPRLFWRRNRLKFCFELVL